MGEVKEEEDVQTGVEKLCKQLEIAIVQYDQSKISSLELLAAANKVWSDAYRKNEYGEANPMGLLIDSILDKKKQALLRQKGQEAFKAGDPVEDEYNPNRWVGKPPPEFAGKDEDFILARTGSLLGLLKEASL